MKLIFLFVLSLLFCGTLLHAQVNISGKITGTGGQPLDEGSVLVLNAADSVVIKGVRFTNGYFSVAVPAQTAILLQFTAIGYREKMVTFPASVLQSNHDAGTVAMEKMIIAGEEARVLARRATVFQQRGANLRVNVQNSLLGNSNSVVELLSKTPFVSITDKQLFVVGRGEAIIYLNGQRIPFERLAGIQVKQILDIEILTNPSAKYEAAGKAVILIRTVKNVQEGIVGFLQQSVTGEHFIYNAAAGLDYKKRRFSLSGGGDYATGYTYQIDRNRKDIYAVSGHYVSELEHIENTHQTAVANFRLGMAIDLDSLSALSAEYNGSYGLYNLDINRVNRITDPALTPSKLTAHNDGQSRSASANYSLNYNTQLKADKGSFFTGLQYFRFDGRLSDNVHEDFFKITPQYGILRNVEGRNLIDIFSAQTDLALKLKQGKLLEAGARIASAKNSGRVDFRSRPDGANTWTVSDAFSNNFRYTETIPAAYLMLSGSVKNNTYKIGARAEMTNANGVAGKTGQKVIDRNYTNLFPTAEWTVKTGKTLLGLSYSARINRPVYQDLDPFVFYQDSLNSLQGNPFLQPERIQTVEASFAAGAFSLKAGYSHSRNPFRYLFRPDTAIPDKVFFRRENFRQLQGYYAVASYSAEKGIWSSFTTASYSYNQIKDDRPEFQLTGIIPEFYIYSYHVFQLKRGPKLEFTGEYTSANSNGMYRKKDKYILTFGITQNFLQKKLQLGFLFSDFVRSYREAGYFKVATTELDYTRKFYTQQFRFTATWNFGNLRNVTYQNRAINNTEVNRVKK